MLAHPRDNVPLAAVLMLAGSALFVALSACVKEAGDEATPMQAVLYRSVFTMLPLAVVAARRRVSVASRRWPLLGLRGLAGFCALYCYFWAVGRMRLADLHALQQLAPIFTAFLSVWLLGERPRPSHYALAGLCMAGALLVVRPTRGALSLPAMVAVVSALFSAAAYVTVRALTRTEPLSRIVLWFALVGALLSAPFVVPGWRWPSLRANLLLVAAGLLAAPAQALMTAAYRLAPAHIAAVFSYANVPLAYLLGLWVWGERPDATASLGIALVALGGALLVGTLHHNGSAQA